MDWPKLPPERLVFFAAAFIPGSAVLLIFHFHNPLLRTAVLAAPYLGYQTRIALLLFLTFLAGWTVIAAFSTLGGMAGGAIGGAVAAIKGFKPSPPEEAQPWRTPGWRALLAQYLGAAAPENIPPVYQLVLDIQLQNAESYPEPQRTQLITEARSKKITADLNDSQWQSWWRHFHHKTLTTFDPVAQMWNALATGFESAALILLAAMPSTPALRRWWLILGCATWVLTALLQFAAAVMNYNNPWSSQTQQIDYLQGALHKGQKGEHSTADA